MKVKVTSLLLLAYFISLITTSCTKDSYDVEKGGKALTHIKQAYLSGFYDKAIDLSRQFGARYPYAKYNMDIELVIADSYFKLGQYLEASMHYSRFIKLYPKHPKKPYALYKVGLAHWQQAPSAIDREQFFTESALKEWKKLIKAYPASPFSIKASKLVKQGEQRILESKEFIASFYCKQGLWSACAYRSLDIVLSYPDKKSYKKDALMLAGKAFKKLAALKKDENDDENLYFRKYSVKELKEMGEGFLTEASKL